MVSGLLLVNVQRHMLEGSAPVPAARQVRTAIARLLGEARAAGAVVVHIQNEGMVGDPDEPNTPGWELVFPVESRDLVVRKTQQNAFVSAVRLAPALRRRHVDRVVVAGLLSQYCVAATCHGAMDRGFSVVLASGAHATYDEKEPARQISVAAERDLAAAGVVVSRPDAIQFAA
ncbi:MAG TPA: isochorismatase family protein [Acidothermales bacterium]|jgi:streptothricin hydrolase